MNDISAEKILNSEHFFLSDVGPRLHPKGVTYRIWAFGHQTVVVHVEKSDGKKYSAELEQVGDSGYFLGEDSRGQAGDLYKVSLDGAGLIPDLASHYQPQGVFGPSMIVDAQAFPWQAKNWKRPAWTGQVVYECHLGTFTAGGTSRSAIEKLDHIVSLGATAVELMPVADWMGERNWGYDGVMLFAPAHCYGAPDDFRAFIDACHSRGLAVILDVVFNHLGAEGNFGHQYSSYYFHEGRDNPWGQNFNLDGPNSEPVRAMLQQNIRYWLEEFRIDGFRMDATHTIHDSSPVHLVAELAEIVHERGGFIIAEDDRNSRHILEGKDKHGWSFDALWSDDFHHAMRVSQTAEQQYFLSMFSGKCEELGEILSKGWLYSGQYSNFYRRRRGTPAEDFPPECFVFCISNHDQVGNRIQGQRLHETITPASYRAISLLLCLVPYTPLIFMGQEWGASTPFDYFTNVSEELGARIAEGRKKSFLDTGFVTDPADLDHLLSSQDERLFIASKLNWSEISINEHGRLLGLYQAALKLRKEMFAGQNPPRSEWDVEATPNQVAIHYRLPTQRISVQLILKPDETSPSPTGTVILRSNAPEFGGTEQDSGPETIVTRIS